MSDTTTHNTSSKSTSRQWYKKRDILRIVLFVLVIGLFRYHRPLDIDDLSRTMYEQDFELHHEVATSAWQEFNDPQGIFGYDYHDKSIYESLNNVDEILRKDHDGQRRRSGDYDAQYVRYSGAQIGELHQDALNELFAGSTGQDIQANLDTLHEALSGKTLEPLDYEYNKLIPQITALHAMTRVGKVYALHQCVSGDTAQCTENLMTLFDLSQKLQRGGISITAFIGMAFESELIESVRFLQKQHPERAEDVLVLLDQYDYASAGEIYEHVLKVEYQGFKNFAEQLPRTYKYDYYGYSIFDALWGGWQNIIVVGVIDSGFDGIVGFMRAFHLPLSWFYSVPETVIFGQLYFEQAINNPGEAIEIEEFLTRRPQPAWSRSNVVGYMILQGLLPESNHIYQRLIHAQEQFDNLLDR